MSLCLLPENAKEGKAAMVAASELGSERVSNERERMSQSFRSLDLIPLPFALSAFSVSVFPQQHCHSWR